MKTAVEWLAERCGLEALEDVIAEAKEMEKEQIIDAYNEGVISVDCRGGNPEKYYNQTFEQ